MRKSATLLRIGVVTAVALIAVGCGDDSPTPTATGTTTLASTFVFGAPPDCATNKFCKQGLKDVYGIEFKEIKSLDYGGPASVAALRSGAAQVVELFSTSVYDESFTILEDDKKLQAADYITPVVRDEVATDDVKALLNGVSAKLTTEGMLALNKQVDIDHKEPDAVAKDFLTQQGLLASKTNTGAGKTITVGVSGAFSESKIVAEMFAQVLANAGYTVKKEFGLESRKVSDAALFGGKIDVKPEYLGAEALAQDPAADVNGDPAHTADVLRPLLSAKKVTLLDYSNAVDTNVFVVTDATAQRYGLSKVSDLAKKV